MNNYVFNKLHNANDGKHKYIAEYINRNTGRPKLIKFGAVNYKDYIIYNKEEGKTVADKKKRNYLARHRPKENWDNELSAGYWSRWVLWNKPTLEQSFDYMKKHKLITLK